MAKKKTLLETKKALQEKMKKVNDKIRKEKEKTPLNFCKELEKIFSKKFTDNDYKNILDAVRQNKSNYATYWKIAPTTTNTTQGKPTPPPTIKK